MTMTPADPAKQPAGAGAWLVRAAYAFTGTGRNVVLTLVDVNSVAVFFDGTKETFRVGTGRPVWMTVPSPPALRRQDQVETLLGGVRLLDAQEALDENPSQLIASFSDEDYRKYAERGARFDVEATVGALGYRVSAVVPLEGRGTGTAGGGRFSVLSARCGAGSCSVVIRDVMPASLLELGRQFRIVYVLVNAPRRQAFLIGERGPSSGMPVFGPVALLTEHVAVRHRRLVFEAPQEMSALIDAGWQKEAAIVAVEIRDIGTFKVRTVVAQRAR